MGSPSGLTNRWTWVGLLGQQFVLKSVEAHTRTPPVETLSGEIIIFQIIEVPRDSLARVKRFRAACPLSKRS